MSLATNIRDIFKRVLRRNSTIPHPGNLTSLPQPMLRLPPELIVLVFELLISDRENPVSPTFLSALSRFIRSLVVASPSLWSYILIDPLSLPHPRHLDLFLHRSQSHPLDILIDIRDPAWNWSEVSHCFHFKHFYVALDKVILQSARWKRFEMLSDTWKPLHDFILRTRSVQTPNLEILSLTRANVYFARYRQPFLPADMAAPLSLFGGAFSPKLRNITLTGVHMEWTQPPFHNLTSLELRYHSLQVMPSLEQFGAICDSCPELRNLTIMGWGPQLPPSSSNAGSGVFVLPRLTSFTFGYVNVEYAIRLLILFNLPSLKKLTIENLQKLVYNQASSPDDTPLFQWFTAPPDQTSPFLPFNAQALPVSEMTHLNINDIGAQQAILIDFVRSFTSLTHLTCHSVNHDTITSILQGALPALSGVMNGTRPQGSIQEIRCRNVEPAALLAFVHGSAQAGVPIPPGTIVLELRDRDASSTDSSSLSSNHSMTGTLIQAGIRVVYFS